MTIHSVKHQPASEQTRPNFPRPFLMSYLLQIDSENTPRSACTLFKHGAVS